MLKPFEQPLHLDLGRSDGLTLFFSLTHIGTAIVAFGYLPWSWVSFLISTLIAVALYRILRLHAFRLSKQSIVELSCSAQGVWTIKTNRSDTSEIVDFVQLSYESRWLLILRCSNAPSLLIPWDAVSEDEFRRLRTRLRMG